eukprot:scpid67299/ scgid30188/ 
MCAETVTFLATNAANAHTTTILVTEKILHRPESRVARAMHSRVYPKSLPTPLLPSSAPRYEESQNLRTLHCEHYMWNAEQHYTHCIAECARQSVPGYGRLSADSAEPLHAIVSPRRQSETSLLSWSTGPANTA